MVTLMKYKLALLGLTLLGFSSAHADTLIRINSTTNHAYQRIDTPVTWQAAQDACVAKGAHLASITSATENSWIEKQLYNPSISSVWIGANDVTSEGTWQWANGESWDYTNWNTGEPNNSGGNENAVEMWMANGGVWNDVTAEAPHSYLCEWDSVPPHLNGYVAYLKNHTVTCTNETTAQTVSFDTNRAIFNCVDHGLTINSGDQVSVNITGKIR